MNVQKEMITNNQDQSQTGLTMPGPVGSDRSDGGLRA